MRTTSPESRLLTRLLALLTLLAVLFTAYSCYTAAQHWRTTLLGPGLQRSTPAGVTP